MKRTLLYYDWFGRHFRRGEGEKARDFDFMAKIREMEERLNAEG